MTNVLVVVIAADYFAKAPEEVLVKMTKGKSEKGQKNQFLGVYMVLCQDLVQIKMRSSAC